MGRVLSKKLRGFSWSLKHKQVKGQSDCSRYDFLLLATKN